MRLGAHIGISNGFGTAVTTALELGCESIQIFSKSPQMWKGPPLSDESAAEFRAAVTRTGIRPTAIHHGYLMNLASPKTPMLRLSRRTFIDELERAEKLGVDQLIFHPGAHLGSGIDAGLATIVESLNWVFEKTAGFRVRALLENSAGQGSSVCSRLEEIQSILERLDQPERAAVTLDTCHLFASGIDFRSEEEYGMLRDRIRSGLGLVRVHAFHLNDAKAALGSHLDRHENIGKGEIGLDGFRHFINDPAWTETPGYLETPLDDDGYSRYASDLRTLRTLSGAADLPPGRRSVTRAPRKDRGSARTS